MGGSLSAAGVYVDQSTKNLTLEVTWSSSDPSIVDIDVFGKITAKAFGTVSISAAKGSLSSAILVTVGLPDVNPEFDQARGNAIILAGGGNSDNLWDVIDTLADYAYEVLTKRGFTAEDIYYLSHEAEAGIVYLPNPEPIDLEYAITTWTPLSTTEGPLYLIMIDHGAFEVFMVQDQGPSGWLYAADFDQWLADFQDATGRQVVVIIEACQSGNFIPFLAKAKRVIVASAEKGKNAFLTKQFPFGKFMFSSLLSGGNLKNSFNSTTTKLKILPSPWKNQTPLLADTTGIAEAIHLGGNFQMASALPVISGGITAQVQDESKIKIRSMVSDLEGLEEVWAVVMPPDFTTSFTTPGAYQVMVFAMDSDGNMVNSEQKTVTLTGGLPTDSCQVYLDSGWNLVSLCRQPTDNSAAAYAESKGFSVLTAIDPGEGFWVNAKEAVVLQ